MSGATVGSAFATGRNAFDAIRLGAALLVLVSHAWVLTGRADAEPFAPLLGHVTDGGGLAVGVFFVLSGFLIARSAQVHPWRDYVRARALRIYPAFAVVIVLQAFVLGPLVTRLPTAPYLTDPATWAGFARALMFSPPAGLPGVFTGVPAAGQVNGSLWTLRIEALCYAGVLALSWLGLLRPGRVWAPLLAGWGLLALVLLARAGVAPAALGALRAGAVVACVLNFLMGAAAWCWRDRLPLRGWLAAALVAAFLLARGTAAGPAAMHLALPYAVLWLGLGPLGGLALRRDISYGIYLSAFPVQQIVVSVLGPAAGPWPVIAIAAPVAIGYGALSRWLVERPALRFKRSAEEFRCVAR